MTQKSPFLRQALMLALATPLAIVATAKSGLILKQPLPLALLCIMVALCFFGSKMESRKIANHASRLLLLVVALTIGLIAMEFMLLGNTAQRVGGLFFCH